jgi:hypothetical protein
VIVASGKAILEESLLPTGSSIFSKPYHNNRIVEEMTRILAASDAEGSEQA